MIRSAGPGRQRTVLSATVTHHYLVYPELVAVVSLEEEALGEHGQGIF